MNISNISTGTFIPSAPRQATITPAKTMPDSTGTNNAGKLFSTEKAVGSDLSEEKLQTSTKKVQEFVNSVVSDIEFSIDEDSGQTVVKVIDRGTKEVIRQIPSEEMLELAKALDKLQGLLLRQEA